MANNKDNRKYTSVERTGVDRYRSHQNFETERKPKDFSQAKNNLQAPKNAPLPTDE